MEECQAMACHRHGNGILLNYKLNYLRLKAKGLPSTKGLHIPNCVYYCVESVQKVPHIVIVSEAKQSIILLITGLLRAAPEAMTLFVSGILRGFSGLLHFVRNDGQRWIASTYDDAFCYVLAKRHFAFSLGTKRVFAMTETELLPLPEQAMTEGLR
jgi:hypothetical protein